jgi:hypothetical protein
MLLTHLLVTAALLGADDTPAASAKAIEALQKFHLAEAQRWSMFVDDRQQTKAQLRTKPIYVWTNPTRSGGQNGAVYVWIHRGRPVVVGSIFSHPEEGKRILCHEFHSLAEEELQPKHPQTEPWEPKAPVEMLPLVGAAAPEQSPSKRLLQMKALARDFTAYSVDYMKERWELRLLGQPLYRYEKPQDDVIDGTIFAFVTSAGTDPEVVLVLEARKQGSGPAWFYRAIRFSDSDLHVQRDGKEVWNSVRDETRNTLYYNPDHTYRLIRDRYVEELPELKAEE